MQHEAVYGITAGDASGVGPEILLKAFATGELRLPFVAYGDLAAMETYNDRLGYGVDLRKIDKPAQHQPGVLNVIDAGLLRSHDITPGKLSRAAGHAAPRVRSSRHARGALARNRGFYHSADQ